MEHIQQLLGANVGLSAALTVALLGLFSRQTEDEHTENAVVSSDGQCFAKSTGLGTVVYELRSGTILKQWKRAAASSIRFSGDSKYLASGQLTDLVLWDLKSDTPVSSWKGANRHSFKMDFSCDSSLLAALDNQSLRVWEVATQKQVLTIRLPFECYSLAFSSDGKAIAVGGTETKEAGTPYHEIKIWEISSEKLITVLKGPEYCLVKSLAFSPNGHQLATGLSNSSCRVWDLRTKKEAWKQDLDNVDYGIAGYTKDGKQLVIGGFQSVTILDAVSGRIGRKFSVPGPAITNLTTLAKEGMLLVANKDGVYSLDLTSGEQQRVFPKKQELDMERSSLRYFPHDGSIRLLRLPSLRLMSDAYAHLLLRDCVSSAQFSALQEPRLQ
jgi:WD40 repeat protein